MDQTGKRRILQGGMENHGQVVRRAAHPRAVESGWSCRASVEGAEFGRERVHFRHGCSVTAELAGKSMRGIVSRRHDQTLHQLPVGVLAALADADSATFSVRVFGRCGDFGVEIEFVERDKSQEHLDGAGRAVATVRIFGGEDLAGFGVREYPS
eukprot:gene26853-biopygen23068